MNKFYMNGKLIHKASNHNTKRCEVEKWVFLPHSDFERLKANPYQEHEAITAARDLMYEDKNAYHCIMLLDEYCDDGLLIEAEGFDYSRLSMFVPDAKSIYERYQTSESELKLHDMIKDTVEKIAELAHTGKTDFTSADMIDMDEVESLVKNAIVQQLAQRYDIKMAKNTDIGVDFQPDIHVEAEKLTKLKFYCPLKVQREIKPSFDEDEDEFFEDTEELSDFEVLEYESEITSAIEAYQSDEEENRGIMAYLGDRKRFADKSIILDIVSNTKAHMNSVDIVKFTKAMRLFNNKDYYTCATILAGLIDSQSINQALIDTTKENVNVSQCWKCYGKVIQEHFASKYFEEEFPYRETVKTGRIPKSISFFASLILLKRKRDDAYEENHIQQHTQSQSLQL